MKIRHQKGKTPGALAGAPRANKFTLVSDPIYSTKCSENQGVKRLVHKHGMPVSTARLVSELSGFGGCLY